MATFRKRNGKWQVIVRHKSIGTVSRSFIAKTQAVKWALEQEERIERGVFGCIEPSKIALSELLQRYSKEITPAKRGAAIEMYRLRRLINDPISSLSIDQLTSQALASFRDKRLKDGEYERLEATSNLTQNPHIWPIVVFAIETGMRRGEILGLEWDNIDLKRRTAFLPLAKNGSSREVPLSPKAISVLQQQRPRTKTHPFPVNSNAFRLAWVRLRSRAGLSDLRFHDLRHEAITRFFEMGLSIPEVALISGHKDVKMLFRYTHLKADSLVSKLA